MWSKLTTKFTYRDVRCRGTPRTYKHVTSLYNLNLTSGHRQCTQRVCKAYEENWRNHKRGITYWILCLVLGDRTLMLGYHNKLLVVELMLTLILKSFDNSFDLKMPCRLRSISEATHCIPYLATQLEFHLTCTIISVLQGADPWDISCLWKDY